MPDQSRVDATSWSMAEGVDWRAFRDTHEAQHGAQSGFWEVEALSQRVEDDLGDGLA